MPSSGSPFPGRAETQRYSAAERATGEFFALTVDSPYVPPADLVTRLLQAVEVAASDSAASMNALRAAVEEYTVNLREQGALPEAVLISLKTLIRNQTFRAESNGGSYMYVDPLRASISTWSINKFFRE